MAPLTITSHCERTQSLLASIYMYSIYRLWRGSTEYKVFNLVSHMYVAHKIVKKQGVRIMPMNMAVVRTLQAGLAVSLHLRLVRPCPCFPMFPKLASPLCAAALGRFWKLCPALVTSLSLPVAPNVIIKSPGRFAGIHRRVGSPDSSV